MTNKKITIKEKLSLLKHENNSDFLITTFIISLLTIIGVFMSHYNSDKFIGRIKVYETVATPTSSSGKITGKGSNKILFVIFNENTLHPSAISHDCIV